MISRAVVLLLWFSTVPLSHCFALPQVVRQLPAPCVRTAEDYGIFGAVVNDLNIRRPVTSWKDKEIVIEASTIFPGYVDARRDWSNRSVSKGAPSEATVADFEANVNSLCPFTESFGDPKSYSIITTAEMNEIFGIGGGNWGEFYKRHPQAAGFWSFSRPGYNKARDEALIHVGYHCGLICAHYELVLLAKENGEWKVKNRLYAGEE